MQSCGNGGEGEWGVDMRKPPLRWTAWGEAGREAGVPAESAFRALVAGGRGGGGCLDGPRLSLGLPSYTVPCGLVAWPLKHEGLQLLLNLF